MFSALRRIFGTAVSGDPIKDEDNPNPQKPLLISLIEPKARRPGANTCLLVIEDREATIDTDPKLAKLRKLHKLQRLTLQMGQTRNGECAVRIMYEPDLLVGVLTGPDAAAICEAIESCGQAWGRVLGSGSTGAGTFRVDLILFWCSGPLPRPEIPIRERTAYAA